MTDKETLIEMMKKANIEFKEHGDYLMVEAGYVGFVTEIYFHPDGSLNSIEAYE
jgi:hypothetical protein